MPSHFRERSNSLDMSNQQRDGRREGARLALWQAAIDTISSQASQVPRLKENKNNKAEMKR
jgi:hypothetical protein